MLNKVSSALVGNTELVSLVGGFDFELNHHVTKSSFLEISPTATTSVTVTMTIANPCVVTWNSHGLSDGTRINFTTTGTLPTGILVSSAYFVRVIDSNTFHLYDTQANALNLASTTGRVITTGSQSGIHTATLNAHKTFTFGYLKEFETIMLIINSTLNANTFSWNTGDTGYTIRWSNQTAPVLSISSGRKDVITFIRIGNEIFGGYALGC